MAIKMQEQLERAKKAQNLRRFFSDVGEEGVFHAKRLEFLRNGCIKNFVVANYGDKSKTTKEKDENIIRNDIDD